MRFRSLGDAARIDAGDSKNWIGRSGGRPGSRVRQ
jgi:hypothetical protein